MDVHASAAQTSELDRLGDEIAELSVHLDAAAARLLDLIRVSGLLRQDGRAGRVVSQSSSRPFRATRMIGFATRWLQAVAGGSFVTGGSPGDLARRLSRAGRAREKALRTLNATASSDCTRISGLSCGALTLRAMMESRARGANRDSGLSSHRVCRLSPRAGRSRFAINVVCRAASGELVRHAGQTAGAAVNSFPLRQTAHAIRASLLASATAALLWPRRRSTCNAHVRNRSGAGAVFVLA
jgi:hypothetical protein